MDKHRCLVKKEKEGLRGPPYSVVRCRCSNPSLFDISPPILQHQAASHQYHLFITLQEARTKIETKHTWWKPDCKWNAPPYHPLDSTDSGPAKSSRLQTLKNYSPSITCPRLGRRMIWSKGFLRTTSHVKNLRKNWQVEPSSHRRLIADDEWADRPWCAYKRHKRS